MGKQLVVPSRQELEGLSPKELWDVAEVAGEIQGRAWELVDEQLRHWVEVEGKTQREIAKLVGRDQSRVSRRCSALGIASGSKRGGDHRSFDAPASNVGDEPEIVEGEIVEDEDGPRRRGPNTPRKAPGAAHVLGARTDPEAANDPRTQLVELYSQGRKVRQLLEDGAKLVPRSDKDREALLRDAQETIKLLQGVRRRLK